MNPKQALEKAAQTYLSDKVTIPVYKGIENNSVVDDTGEQRRVVPCVTVACEGDLVEAIPFTGNWQGVLTVSVEASTFQNTDEAFDALCDGVFSKFNTSDVRALLSAASANFTCLFTNLEGISGRFTQGNNWVNTIRLAVVFCESDL